LPRLQFLTMAWHDMAIEQHTGNELESSDPRKKSDPPRNAKNKRRIITTYRIPSLATLSVCGCVSVCVCVCVCVWWGLGSGASVASMRPLNESIKRRGWKRGVLIYVIALTSLLTQDVGCCSFSSFQIPSLFFLFLLFYIVVVTSLFSAFLVCSGFLSFTSFSIHWFSFSFSLLIWFSCVVTLLAAIRRSWL